MHDLRQSTAATAAFGPFVSPTDAVTLQAALGTQAGRLVKNGTGSAFTAASWTYDANGFYLVGFGTGDTDTVGRLTVSFSSPTNYLPVWKEFRVLSAAVYDWLYGTAAPLVDKAGFALTTAEHTAIAADVLDVTASTHNTAGTIGAKINSAGAAADPWATALPGSYGAGTAGALVGTNLNATVGSRMATFTLPNNFASLAITVGGGVTVATNNDKLGYTASTVTDKTGYSLAAADSSAVHSGTAQAGGTNSITLATGASAIDNLYAGNRIKLTGGTGAGQARGIPAYSGTTKVLTVDRPWVVTPDTTTTYTIVAANDAALNASLQNTVAVVLDKTGYALLSSEHAAISGDVLSQPAASYNVSGTIGARINAAGIASDPWDAALPGSHAAGTAGYLIGTFLDAQVSTRSTYAGTDTSGTTTLLARLTATRATNLDNLDATVSSRSTYTGTAVVLAANGLDSVSIETGFNARQALALVLSEATGKWSGGGTGTATFLAAGGTATRIVATIDATGRTAVTLTPPA